RICALWRNNATHPEITKQVTAQASKTLLGAARVGTKSAKASRTIEAMPLIRHTQNAVRNHASFHLGAFANGFINCRTVAQRCLRVILIFRAIRPVYARSSDNSQTRSAIPASMAGVTRNER